MTQHIEEARELEPEWRYEIQYGPEGEANYAWLYRGNEMVATMKTRHAVSVCAALAAAEERRRSEERERARQVLSPADVFRVIKRYKDNGRFDWDFVSQMCRDIAAITKEPTP